ncbi:MAG: hypothetical protein STSR0007_02080 [Thermovirga sp.]
MLVVFLAFLTGVFFALVDRSCERVFFPGAIVVDGVPDPSPAEEKHPGTDLLSGNRKDKVETFEFRPVSGEPFSKSDLESVEDPSTVIVPKKSGDEVFDISTIHPIVGKTADQVLEMIEEFDSRTLDVTREALKKVPILDIHPDKAELRPTGDGIKLTLTMDPEDIGLNMGKQVASDDAVVSGDEAALEE